MIEHFETYLSLTGVPRLPWGVQTAASLYDCGGRTVTKSGALRFSLLTLNSEQATDGCSRGVAEMDGLSETFGSLRFHGDQFLIGDESCFAQIEMSSAKVPALCAPSL